MPVLLWTAVCFTGAIICTLYSAEVVFDWDVIPFSDIHGCPEMLGFLIMGPIVNIGYWSYCLKVLDTPTSMALFVALTPLQWLLPYWWAMNRIRENKPTYWAWWIAAYLGLSLLALRTVR